MNRLESEKNVLKLLGALNYCLEYFSNKHVLLVPLHTLLHEKVFFHWNKEHDAVFPPSETISNAKLRADTADYEKIVFFCYG